MNLDEEGLHYIRGLPCLVCGNKPCHGAMVKPVDEGGPHELFNLFPLCTKHCHEYMRLKTMDFINKYLDVKKHLLHRGWTFARVITHPKMGGLI